MSKVQPSSNVRLHTYKAIGNFLLRQLHNNETDKRNSLELAYDCVKIIHNTVYYEEYFEIPDPKHKTVPSQVKASECKKPETSYQRVYDFSEEVRRFIEQQPSISQQESPKKSAGNNSAEAIIVKQNSKVLSNNTLKKLYEDAVLKFTRAIEDDPLDATFFYKRGIAYGHLEKLRESIADLETALELNPDYHKIYGKLGLQYAELCILDQAKDMLLQALNHEPTNLLYRKTLELVYLQINLEKADGFFSHESSEEFRKIKFNEDILHAATQLLLEPSSTNIVLGMLKGNPVNDQMTITVQAILYMKNILAVDPNDVVYQLPLSSTLELYSDKVDTDETFKGRRKHKKKKANNY